MNLLLSFLYSVVSFVLNDILFLLGCKFDIGCNFLIK